MKLYLDDQLIGHNENVVNEMSNLGKNLKAYLGKSFYGEVSALKEHLTILKFTTVCLQMQN